MFSSQDYINVSSDGVLLAKLCGSQLPSPVYASSTMSIAIATGKGFHAIYQAVGNGFMLRLWSPAHYDMST